MRARPLTEETGRKLAVVRRSEIWFVPKSHPRSWLKGLTEQWNKTEEDITLVYVTMLILAPQQVMCSPFHLLEL